MTALFLQVVDMSRVASFVIFLPSFLEEAGQEYIILHEQQHMKRKDHLIKMAAYAVLCVHWFNPLVWLTFIL